MEVPGILLAENMPSLLLSVPQLSEDSRLDLYTIMMSYVLFSSLEDSRYGR